MHKDKKYIKIIGKNLHGIWKIALKDEMTLYVYMRLVANLSYLTWCDYRNFNVYKFGRIQRTLLLSRISLLCCGFRWFTSSFFKTKYLWNLWKSSNLIHSLRCFKDERCAIYSYPSNTNLIKTKRALILLILNMFYTLGK